jgi:hypothetical protein
MILQLKAVFVLHLVDLKRRNCFNPNNKETVTGSFGMRQETSCAEFRQEERRTILCSVHDEVIYFLFL